MLPSNGTSTSLYAAEEVLNVVKNRATLCRFEPDRKEFDFCHTLPSFTYKGLLYSSETAQLFLFSNQGNYITASRVNITKTKLSITKITTLKERKTQKQTCISSPILHFPQKKTIFP